MRGADELSSNIVQDDFLLNSGRLSLAVPYASHCQQAAHEAGM